MTELAQGNELAEENGSPQISHQGALPLLLCEHGKLSGNFGFGGKDRWAAVVKSDFFILPLQRACNYLPYCMQANSRQHATVGGAESVKFEAGDSNHAGSNFCNV